MTNWQKSSISGNSNQCIEVRAADDGMIEIRESDTAEIIVRTTPQKWDAFVKGVQAGEFDHFVDL
ncbi:DUF397 domain-containing protein [Kitasatospora sp. CM 4170]|uniref:DUF397 domain-containing protein n=1 Tax=Kitasatospora aburaviensis TaxID=67265 RepID=A0ABW1EYV3_9ACTN|nr:DUF397 domain-containing protein [Kitasatospora sp. CM 4170]WNM47054.1 DUF397 domain-containing protein [Kitasatospora sp. CM 4170]